MGSVSEKVVNKGFELFWHEGYLTLNETITGKPTPKFSKKTLIELHEIFIEDIEKTSKLINRDLSHWNKLPTFTEKQKKW